LKSLFGGDDEWGCGYVLHCAVIIEGHGALTSFTPNGSLLRRQIIQSHALSSALLLDPLDAVQIRVSVQILGLPALLLVNLIDAVLKVGSSSSAVLKTFLILLLQALAFLLNLDV